MLLSAEKVYTLNQKFSNHQRFQTTELSLDITGEGSINWYSSNEPMDDVNNVYDLQPEPDNPFIDNGFGYKINPLRSYIGYTVVSGNPKVTIPLGLYEVANNDI